MNVPRMRRVASLLGAGLLVVALVPSAGNAHSEEITRVTTKAGEYGVAAPARPGAQSIAATRFSVLQMNLCNSGHAKCYAGGIALGDAENLIRFLRTDVVSLNEVCRDDIVVDLYPAYREARPNDHTFYSWTAVKQKGGGVISTCTNGEPYVVGVMGAIPAARYGGFDAVHGWYDGALADLQHPDDEWRAWTCASAKGVYDACTTHLTNDSGTIARDQCQNLMGSTIVPVWREVDEAATPAVVAGDLNLTFGGSPSAQECVPSGWFRKGDGDVQHITVTNDFTFVESHNLPMCVDGRVPRCSSDHPAWLVVYDMT